MSYRRSGRIGKGAWVFADGAKLCDKQKHIMSLSKMNKRRSNRAWYLATSLGVLLTEKVVPMGVALSLLATSGCLKLLTEKPLEPGSYGSTEPELLRLWQDVLEAAKRDDRDKLTELMSSMRLSQDELATLVGDDKARRFWPRYELLARPLGAPGAAELVGSIYEHHYDDVEVTRVDTLPVEKLSESEQGVRRALLKPTPFYRVRVIKKGTPYAIRYDFFVYQHGFWRTGRELGKFLEPQKIVPLAPAPPRDAGVPKPDAATVDMSPQKVDTKKSPG